MYARYFTSPFETDEKFMHVYIASYISDTCRILHTYDDKQRHSIIAARSVIVHNYTLLWPSNPLNYFRNKASFMLYVVYII